jgi:hypothetical protein
MPVSDWVSPEVRRALLLAVVASTHVNWRWLVNSRIPDPYLDEVFHVPQAQAYWAGMWTQWDSKITTPPALYGFSYVLSLVRWAWDPSEFECSAAELRLTNVVLVYMLLVALYVWAAVSRREVNEQSVLQREYCIVSFPLIFFFSGLYYTDLLSTFTVVMAYIFWISASQAEGFRRWFYQVLHLLMGLLAVASRQTNIFWVAVFLGGLQVIDTLKTLNGAKSVHDPAIAEAYFEGQQPGGRAQPVCTNPDTLCRLSNYHYIDRPRSVLSNSKPAAGSLAASCSARRFCWFRRLERRSRVRYVVHLLFACSSLIRCRRQI